MQTTLTTHIIYGKDNPYYPGKYVLAGPDIEGGVIASPSLGHLRGLIPPGSERSENFYNDDRIMEVWL